MVPIMAVSFVSVLHWPQLLALFGIGSDRADWGIRIKKSPLPADYTLSMLMAQFALEWLPYLEELIRTIGAARQSGARVSPR
jgi:hypothetical protein